jgi:hypothetical protein
MLLRTMRRAAVDLILVPILAPLDSDSAAGVALLVSAVYGAGRSFTAELLAATE